MNQNYPQSDGGEQKKKEKESENIWKGWEWTGARLDACGWPWASYLTSQGCYEVKAINITYNNQTII